MTSNIGSQFILEERDPKAREQGVMQLVRQHFRPEFLNRIDEIVTFSHLEKEQLREIIGLHVERLNGLLKDRSLSLELSPEAATLIAERGYDRDFGARPMKRVFQRELQDPLAVEILEGKHPPGSRVRVDTEGGKLRFSDVAPSREAARAG
jgi:ATP-dependent Clp protease ATP-binding subunit ClpB